MPTKPSTRAVRPFHVTSADYCRWGIAGTKIRLRPDEVTMVAEAAGVPSVRREDGTAAWDVWTLNETIALLSRPACEHKQPADKDETRRPLLRLEGGYTTCAACGTKD